MNNDLISRTALISAFLNRQRSEHEAKYHTLSGEEVLAMIQNAPAVKALTTNDELKDFAKENFDIGYEMAKEKFKRSQGEWIVDGWSKIIECNKCRGQAPIDVTSGEQFRSNFCPICGADMRKGEK